MCKWSICTIDNKPQIKTINETANAKNNYNF